MFRTTRKKSNNLYRIELFKNLDGVIHKIIQMRVQNGSEKRINMRTLRIFLVMFGALIFLPGFGLLIRSEWVMNRWLWPNAPWHSFFFMASILFAFSFGYFTTAIQGKLRPLRNLAITGAISFGGVSLYLLNASVNAVGSDHQHRLFQWGELFLAYSILNAIFWAISNNQGYTKKEPVPVTLRWILGFILTINLWVSLKLIAGIGSAFAWQLPPERAITYGWALLGGAILVFFACKEPYWENQWPLFATFVAYDLTLIGPLFYMLLNPIETEKIILSKTIIYLAMVLGSLTMVIASSLYYRRLKLERPSRG